MWFVNLARTAAERVLIWCLCREAEARGIDLALARPSAQHFVERAKTDAMDAATWKHGEARIQQDRLSKRFDIGAALNEGANRAIGEKKALEQHAADSGLTSRQLAALKFQQEYLQRVVSKA